MESTSCELALKPSLYNDNPIIHTNSFRSGNNRFSRYFSFVRGKHPLSLHPVSRPGKTPTFRAPQSPPKWTPTSAAGFREPPNKPASPRETPYTTLSVFPADSVSVIPLYMYPARAGIPLWIGGLTPRSGLWLMRCESCQNRLTIHFPSFFEQHCTSRQITNIEI